MPPPSSEYPLELYVRCAERKLARCLLRPGQYYLGQQRANDIVVDHDSVSGRHARLLVVSENELYLEDLRSSNGSYVDGALCQEPVRLYPSSEAQIGDCPLVLRRGGLPAEVFAHLPENFMSRRRYELGETVAEGSTSTILEAMDLALQRPVAVRIMQPEAQHVPRTTLRFIREAQLMAQLQHPHIPPVHELVVNAHGQLQYTTRLLAAQPLADLLPRLAAGDVATLARWPLPALLVAWQKAADAVAYAHARGVVHCALRPESVVVGEFGETLVLGWTFAAVLPEDGESGRASAQVHVSDEVPAAPITPYTAPELALGTGIFDERVDIYALGALLYAMLSYTPPFPDDDEETLRATIINGLTAVPPTAAGVPSGSPAHIARERLREIVLRTLSTSPTRRPASVRALQAEVAECQHGALLVTETGGRWKGLIDH